MLNSLVDPFPLDLDLRYRVSVIWAGKVRAAKDSWFFYGSRDNLKLTLNFHYEMDCKVFCMSNIPPQNPYQQPVSYAVPQTQTQLQPQKDQTLAIIALITGILSPTLGVLCCMFLPLGLVALITGLLGMQKVSRGTGEGYGMALAGVILGGGTLLLYGAFFAYLFFGAQSEFNGINFDY